MVVYEALESSDILNCAANLAFAECYAVPGEVLTKAAGAF